jgi:hypothetical protein
MSAWSLRPNRFAIGRGAVLLLTATMLAALTHPAAAQLATGDTIRLRGFRPEVARWTFQGVDSTAFYLMPVGGFDTIRVAFSEIGGVEVLRGRARGGFSSFGKGTLIGGSIGLGFGLWVIAAEPGNHNSEQFVSPAGVVVIMTTLGTAAGAVAGGIASMIPTDQWVDLDMGRTAREVRSSNPSDRLVTMGDTVQLQRGGLIVADGVLVAAGTDRLVVAPLGGGDTIAVRIANIGRADVQRGTSRLGAKTVGQSAALGGLIAGTIGIASAHKLGWGLVAASVGATLGTLLGSGAALVPTAAWIRFDPATMAIVADGAR